MRVDIWPVEELNDLPEMTLATFSDLIDTLIGKYGPEAVLQFDSGISHVTCTVEVKTP